MAQVKRYSPETRDRAIRMVLDHRGSIHSKWAAIHSVASKLGMTPETLRRWIRQAEIDSERARRRNERGTRALAGARTRER